MEVRVAVKRVRAEAHLPMYATPGAAGLDLYTCVDSPTEIPRGAGALLPTGVAVAIPAGYVGLVRDRSSLAVQGLHTVAGVIDSDYRGEVMVAIRNAGQAAATVQPGQRVAQILIIPCPRALVEELDELPATERGSGGFGSTGR
jgi:dUTP pyrophosphatase